MISEHYFSEYKRWLESEKVSDELKKELLSLEQNEEKLRLRFGTQLIFGAAGLRGVMGAGPII